MNQIIRLVISIGCLIAINSSLAPVSAADFVIMGRWDFSEATARTNKLCLPLDEYPPETLKREGTSEDTTATHLLTFNKRSSRISRPSHHSPFKKVYLALATRDLKVIKKVYEVSFDGFGDEHVIAWNNAYPNLCLLRADRRGERRLPPATFQNFRLWQEWKARPPNAVFQGTLPSVPPKYPIVTGIPSRSKKTRTQRH